MKKLSEWIKQKFTSGDEDWTKMSVSIQKMAAENGINRRKNARIIYPHSNYSAKLPQVIVNGTPEIPVDISLGGVCVLNDKNQFGLKTGDEIEIAFRWLNEPDQTAKAVVVGQSYNKVHLKFDQLPTEIYVKLSINLKSGMIGRKFQQSFLNENDHIQAEYAELWVGLNNEKLVFFEEDSVSSELSYFGITTHFFNDKKPTVVNKQGHSIEFSSGQLSDSIILLTNIPSPSRKVKELLSVLENFDNYYRSAG